MKAFIKDALSENGSASIKRTTLVVLLFAFLSTLVVNLGWGKLLDPTLRDELYYAFLGTLGTVFGINVLNGIKDIKIAQSNNNAAVGSPSPTPDPPETTTIVK